MSGRIPVRAAVLSFFARRLGQRLFANNFVDGGYTGDDAAGVILLAEVRYDVVSGDAFRDGVGQYTFETVADFEAEPAVFDRDHQDRAVIMPLFSDLPVLRNADAEALDIFAVKGRDRQHHDLMTGIAFKLGELGLERLGLTRLQHVSVVVDAAAQGWHVERDWQPNTVSEGR